MLLLNLFVDVTFSLLDDDSEGGLCMLRDTAGVLFFLMRCDDGAIVCAKDYGLMATCYISCGGVLTGFNFRTLQLSIVQAV